LEKMSMPTRKEYQQIMRDRYWKARDKAAKTGILDEYCRTTGHNRKYAITCLGSERRVEGKKRKGRPVNYDGEVVAVLVRVWEMFDYPCGQRLKSVLETELERLRIMGEVVCSDEVVHKLGVMSPATIDRKLRRQKDMTGFGGVRGSSGRPSHHLKHKIAVRLTEWDTSEVGNVEVDLVAHCGSSTAGEFVNTVSVTEIGSGWWEGMAIMGKTQEATFQALREIRGKCPFEWKALDSDNGSEFINDILYKYCRRERIEFTRSRPGKKNDNAYIEGKNWTHVRKVVGYRRHDTAREQQILDEIYSQLVLYKNFFQPMMKLASKERIGGKVKRRYEKAKTPYLRLVDSGQLSPEAKLQLQATYLSLNPAEIKRSIDANLDRLAQAYRAKKNVPEAQMDRTQTTPMVR